MIIFNTNGMIAQRFSFPAPIMDYVLENLQPHHLVKLYSTCKFFYAKYRKNIIRHLEIVNDGETEMLTPSKTIINVSNPALEELKDFWISDSFVYRAPLYAEFLSDFSHCTIRKLEACYCFIWSEYEALTEAGTIQELKIGEVFRYGKLVPLVKIIAQVPIATTIEITAVRIAPTTLASLASLDHKGKITKFVLKNITSPNYCNLDLVYEFLKKHAAVDCTVHLDFMLISFLDYAHIELRRMGIEYTELLSAKLEAKKNLAIQE